LYGIRQTGILALSRAFLVLLSVLYVAVGTLEIGNWTENGR